MQHALRVGKRLGRTDLLKHACEQRVRHGKIALEAGIVRIVGGELDRIKQRYLGE